VISTRSAVSCPRSGRPRCSTCRGCRSFWSRTFFLHPWLGWLVVAGGLVIVLLTYVTELKSRKAAQAQLMSGAARQAIVEASRRNAEALTAMGMGAQLPAQMGELEPAPCS
jgi:ATP-binding cassette subfamily C protein PrsD